MAVYTLLDQEHIDTLRNAYGVHAITAMQPIAEGVENSNYLLTAQLDDVSAPVSLILTIFEARTPANDLPYFMALKEHLHAAGFPCPLPLVTVHGDNLVDVAGKKAAIVSFLEGKSIVEPAAHHCAQAGEALARLHSLTQHFPAYRANSMDVAAWQALQQRMRGAQMTETQHEMWQAVADELDDLERHHDAMCAVPHGVIHGDLFPNNVFFDAQGTLCGVIDFYFACHGAYLYDIAIALNAWCVQAGQYDNMLADALLDAYAALRPLSELEQRILPIFKRKAAVRFLVSRLHDEIFHDDAMLVTPHDPTEYYRILQYHQKNSS